MTNLTGFTRSCLVLGFLVAGCGGGGKMTAGDGSAPPDGASACPSGGGNGTLTINIDGTPGEVGAVVVTGGTAQNVSGDMELTVAAGAYTVAASRVAVAGTLVRTAYEPAIDTAAPCVRAGQTTQVNVTYAPIPTSDRLWVGNALTTASMLGFDPATVATTGTPAAVVAADTGGSDGFTFDAAGNLWVVGGTTADAPLARYRAASLASSGAKTPDVTIDSPSFGGGLPGPKVVAFDSAGNLWVSVVWADKVVRFTPAQLAAGGAPTAAVEIGGISGPAGIAFDAAGNMFVATADATIVRIDKNHLVASGNTADMTLTAMTPGPVIGTLSSPTGLAFDASGNLWVSYDVHIVRLTSADIAGTGPKTVTPTVQITLDVAALPLGIAFDEQGGLWVAASAGKFARLGATQLAASGNVTPATIITSASVGYAGWFAIYPAPAATPLAHRLP